MSRSLPRLAAAFFPCALLGCSLGPTRADAEQFLRSGQPAQALRAARAAAERASPEEAPALRRLAFQAGLAAGWSHEAAREYLILRQLTGQDEPDLLAELGQQALTSAVGRAAPAERLAAAACAAWAPGGAELAGSALRDPLEEVRGAACASAARLPWSQALLLLGEAVRQDPSAWVRAEALRSLRGALVERTRRGDPAPAAPLLSLAQAGAADPEPVVRSLSIGLLAELSCQERRSPARAEAVARPAPEGAVQALLGSARGPGSDAGERALAAAALARLDPQLAHAVGAPSQVGSSAGAWQAAFSEPADLSRLRAALNGPDYRERLLVCRALQGPLAGRLIAELSQVAGGDPVTPVRAAALVALGHAARASGAGPPARGDQGRDEARAALRAQLRHAHPANRRGALRALLDARALPLEEPLTPETELLLGDPALAADLVGALARTPVGLGRLREIVHGPRHAPAFRPALQALVAHAAAAGSAQEESLRPLLLELLADTDPALVALAARGLSSAAQRDDRQALVQVVANPAQGAELAAAAALLSLEERERLARHELTD